LIENDEHLLEFINKARWQTAKTYPNDPHEYTIRDWNDDQEFEAAARYVREHGTEERWWGNVRPYYYIGELKYWSMGAPYNETTVLNRAVPGTSSYERRKNKY
jgi:hypothetical protein